MKKNTYPKMTLDEYNKLPLRDDEIIDGLYDGYIKFANQEVEVGNLMAVLKSTPNEDEKIDLTIEKFKII